MNHEFPSGGRVDPELHVLAEKFYLQLLTEPENKRLNESLRNDPAARSFFLAYGSIHARLSYEYGPPLSEQPVRAFRRAENAHEQNPGPEQGTAFKVLDWLSRHLVPTLSVVGIIITLAILVAVLARRSSTTDSNSFATLTRSVGAQTTESRGALRSGQPLGPGRISLDAGAIEVTMNNGVSLVLEGPATLELLTPMRAFLHAGQTVVRVPKSANGFILETREVNIVNLGTEFGVKVGPEHNTDIQVYQGVVISTAKSASGQTNAPQRLTAGSAARLNPEAKNTMQPLAFVPDRFVRQLPQGGNGNNSQTLLFNQPTLDRITILSAAKPITIDGDLSEWNFDGAIRAQGNAPFASAYRFEGMMMYDSEFLYLAAHVTDPFPMRSVIDPSTDGETGWKGGGIQVRLCTDRALSWPIDANADIYYQGTSMKLRPQDLSEKIVHLTVWYYAPGKKDCLHIAHGMDFHGTQTNPVGYRGAFRKDADGRGYTMEYAIPWSLLGAEHALRPSDSIPVTWTVHWSDDSGRLWRGQLIELHNPSEPIRNNDWGHAMSWGRADFR